MDLLAWLDETALPLWWTHGADHTHGGFFEHIDQAGRPVRVVRRARVNTRQTFVYAEAMQRPGGADYALAARHGLSFIIDKLMRPDGLIRSRLDVEGHPFDDHTSLYEQAFCLFALASSAGAGLDPLACRDRARVLMARLDAEWRHPLGGFVEHEATSLQANPHMHLFEAALSWEQIDPTGPWTGVADEIAELARSWFIDSETGVLREFFDDQGRPASGEAGHLVEPGHQMEWCWLLTRYGRSRGVSSVLEAARRLYRIGRDFGVDDARGVMFNELEDDLAPRSLRARLWPQTEWLKAAAILHEEAQGEERLVLEQDAARAARALSLYLQTPLLGLWYDKMEPDGGFAPEPAPASSFYHIACALWDAEARGLKF